MVRGVVETDPWSMQPMTPKDYRRLCVYPVHSLECKVMVFAVDASKTSFLIIDPDCLISIIKDIHIPHYSKTEDVRVNLPGKSYPVLALVRH